MSDSAIDILLVEDNPGDAELVKMAFAKSARHFEVHHRVRLTEAISSLRETAFDAVLLDLSLPDSEGLDGLKRIHDAAPEIPVVVLTSLASDRVAMRMLDEGAQDYLVKGQVSTGLLERTVRYAIHRQQSRAEIERLLAEVRASQELLEKKNRRLAKLYKMANRFVDNVSHEFRTPLTVIKEYVSLVREGIVGDVNEEQARMLDVAGDRADDLNNMVDDMLDVSKLEAGVLGAWRKNANVAEIVHHVRPGLERKASIKNVMLDFALADSLPAVFCDSEKVGRILINLAINAIKFCGDPGIVRIWARPDADSRNVVLGVTDNGPGIDAKGLSVIFQRFKQIGANAKGSTKGFGLGLAIAKELVDLNFGDMTVESEVGNGSTFSFTVPVADPKEVMRRYLPRLKRHDAGSVAVNLVQAEIESDVTLELADDVGSFLHYLLRQHDLLFRAGPRRWLLVLELRKDLLDRFLARARQSFDEANRNRPRGPLPEIDFRDEGNWNVTLKSEDILARMDELLEPAEIIHG